MACVALNDLRNYCRDANMASNQLLRAVFRGKGNFAFHKTALTSRGLQIERFDGSLSAFFLAEMMRSRRNKSMPTVRSGPGVGMS